MQLKETDQAAHLPVYIHFCAARAAERSAREAMLPENKLQKEKSTRGTSDKRKEEGADI